MKQYNEISSIFNKEPLSYDTIRGKYKKLDVYNLTPQDYVRILSKEPNHPLAKRFDKLVRYTARLIGNPNINEIKQTYIKLLKKSLLQNTLVNDDIHDLVHLILGQNIKIFLRREIYSPEEQIYETIAIALEEGLTSAARYFSERIDLGGIINKKTVPLDQIYSEEFEVFDLFYQNNKQDYSRREFRFFKTLFVHRKFFNIINLYKFFTIYEMNSAYPLAINFKNEILRELNKVVTSSYINTYKKKLYTLLSSVGFAIDEYSMNKLYYNHDMRNYLITTSFLRDLFRNIEVFPETTRVIIEKFIIYAYTVLHKYPVNY